MILVPTNLKNFASFAHYSRLLCTDGCVDVLGDDVDHWVVCGVSQALLLSLEMRWTGELYSALTTDNPLQQLRHIW